MTALGLAHGAALSRPLLARVQNTPFERLGEAKHLGPRPGMSATFHPWSQTLVLQPPRHGLVSGGGLTAAGQWVAVRHDVLLPMRVAMAGCRGTRRAAICQGWPQGRLTPPEGKGRQPVDHGLHTMGRQQWNVPIRERSPHGSGGLICLARDLRGGPLATRRLRARDGQQVVFRDAARAKGPGGQAPPRTMSLRFEPFLGRWRLHVPPAHPHRVRWRGR